MLEFIGFVDVFDLYGFNDVINENFWIKVDGIYWIELLWLDIYV